MIPDPTCMTPGELGAWREQAAYIRLSWGERATNDPCADCTMAFHLEQRSRGTCNGIPGLVRKGASGSSKAAIAQRLRRFRRTLVDKGLDPAHAEAVG